MKQLRNFLLSLSRRQKRVLQLLADVMLIWLSLWLSFAVRLGDIGAARPLSEHAWLFAVAPLVALPIFIRLGMYRAVMRYVGNDALLAIAKAVTLSALVLALIIYWYSGSSVLVPRSMVFNYWWLSFLLLGGLRVLMRKFFSIIPESQLKVVHSDGVRIAIYGAGESGNQLLAALRLSRAFTVVAFVDSDKNVANQIIAGLRVYSPERIQQMIAETGAREILLAMPSISRARRREILAELEPFGLHVRSVPAFADLASGRVKVEDLQEVDIVDLLGRDAVAPEQALFERCIKGKVVLVSGAGGSIGAELCRQIIGSGVSSLLLLDHCEYSLYRINEELRGFVTRESLAVKLIPILGTLRDVRRLENTLQSWGVDTVYHAAAYKHVPLVEHNIAEGVLNNLMGTINLAQAAIKARVKNFVLISTDKAVRPTNIMGSTKRLAEMVLQGLSAESAPLLFGDNSGVHCLNQTRFTMVRFGNVLGSSGSVIPLFREQIKRGGPVTVTHPNITRYFMTIPEAAQLVIQAGSMGRGGDVFVLDMGEPVKIAELAEKMISLSGLTLRDTRNPGGDIAIEFTGLRPGEKLYEELLIGGNASPTEHPMIMRAQEDMLPWGELKLRLERLLAALECDNYPLVRTLLRETVQGYAPDSDIVDWVHLRAKEL